MVLLNPVALFALALLAPLAGFEWMRLRRERRAARAVGLQPQRLWRAMGNGVCAGILIALTAFAASEPSLQRTTRVKLRANAEVYLFVDSSASMLASASPHSPTRLQQARSASADFARDLPADLPLGAGALPQAPLPLTAPNGDRQLFLTAIDTMTTPGSLPEHLYGGRTATDFSNLTTLTSTHFFLPKTRRRIVVVLSDGEGPSFDTASTAASLKSAHIRLVFVRFGSPQDRIWLHSPGRRPLLDTKYEPDLTDLGEVHLLAAETGGAFYDQGAIGAAVDKVNRLVGHGRDRSAEPLSLFADSLGPYVLLAALPFVAWLAGALLPLSTPLKARSPRLPRKSLQRTSEAASNQA